MWVYSEKQKTWVNLEQVQRIASDGQGGYLLISQDGKKTSIDQTWYDKAMRWVDPDWWEKHPNGGKDSLNFEDALKAIMKATGAKMDKRIRIRKRGKISISPLSKESSIVLRLFYQFRYIFNNLFVCLIDIRKVLLNINISNF